LNVVGVITKLEKIEPIELNSEYILKFSNGRFSEIDDLKEYLSISFQEQIDAITKIIIRENASQILFEIAQQNIEVPKLVVETVLNKMVEDRIKNKTIELNEEAINDEKEKHRKMITESIALDILKTIIIKESELELTDDDAQAFFSRNGLLNDYPDFKANLKFLETFDKDGKASSMIMLEKIIDHVLGMFAYEEVKIEDPEREDLISGLKVIPLDSSSNNDFKDEDYDVENFDDNEHIHDDSCKH